MSSADRTVEVRRAVFRDALHRGDPLAAARAAARLQPHADTLDPAERAAARAARLALGRAVREARDRRDAPEPAVFTAAAIRASGRSWPVRRALIAAAVLFIAVAMAGSLTRTDPSSSGEAGGGAAAPAVEPAPVVAQSRGRVVLALAAVAVPAAVEPIATAMPDPVTVLSPAPAASGAPSASGRPGSGTPGPSGSGSGVGAPGGPVGTPRPTPTLTPAPRPTPLPPLARGFARLSGQVLDQSTGRGIPGACVSLGPCSAVSPLTDANGRWTLDLPVGSGRLDWGLEFAKTGYGTLPLNVRARTGYIFLGSERLQLTP